MRIVILGAGISGLTLAWVLQRRYGQEVSLTLVESRPRLGGWIQTLNQGGFLFDVGPHSCRAEGNGGETLHFIEQLGLKSSLVYASAKAKTRYLYTGGKLHPLPTRPWHFFTSPIARPLLWRLLKEWRIERVPEEESIHAFITRRLGPYVADTFFDPMTAGIYAGDSRQLSMRACFPLLHEWEQSAGSLTHGFLRSWRQPSKQNVGLFSLRGGMQELVDAFQTQLEADIRLGVSAVSLCQGVVVLSTGEKLKADRVFICLPAQAAAQVLSEAAPQSSALLNTIPANTLTVVSLGYGTPQLNFEGYGYLVPSYEGETLLGMVWDSSIFPQQNRWIGQTRLTAMIAGQPGEPLEIALAAAEKHLGIRQAPDVLAVTVTPQAIPQYTIGHLDRVKALEKAIKQEMPTVTLLGNSLYGVSVNDCMAMASHVS